MHTVGLDHLVVNTRDVEQAVTFYRDVLSMEILRLDELRQGKVGFVSVRVSPEIIIDIRPSASGETVTPNMDQFLPGAWADGHAPAPHGIEGQGREGRGRSPAGVGGAGVWPAVQIVGPGREQNRAEVLHDTQVNAPRRS